MSTDGGECRERHALDAGISAVHVVEEVLVQTRVLRVIRSDLLFAFDLNTDLQSDRS